MYVNYYEYLYILKENFIYVINNFYKDKYYLKNK